MIRVTKMPTTSTNGPPMQARSVRDLEMLSGVLSAVALRVPERTSVRQLLFFLTAAFMDIQNRPGGMTDIVDLLGDSDNLDAKGARKPLLGRGIEASYVLFLEPNKRNPDALGWLTAVEDEDNRRRKLIRLTDKGRKIIDGLSTAVHAA